MAAVSVQLNLDTELNQRLERLAEARAQSPESIMELAITEYIEREDEWDREAIESYEEYQRTGLHLTNDEVLEWLEKLASGEDAPLPPCHT